MNPDDDGTPGKKPPAPSVSQQAMTLLLRKTRDQSRIEGGNPELWAEAENDYAIVDADTNKRVGRIYPEMIRGEPKWLWFLQTEPAPPPNSGKTDSLEEAQAAFKRRYAEVKGRT
jgi:hypothetical protein